MPEVFDIAAELDEIPLYGTVLINGYQVHRTGPQAFWIDGSFFTTRDDAAEFLSISPPERE